MPRPVTAAHLCMRSPAYGTSFHWQIMRLVLKAWSLLTKWYPPSVFNKNSTLIGSQFVPAWELLGEKAWSVNSSWLGNRDWAFVSFFLPLFLGFWYPNLIMRWPKRLSRTVVNLFTIMMVYRKCASALNLKKKIFKPGQSCQGQGKLHFCKYF